MLRTPYYTKPLPNPVAEQRAVTVALAHIPLGWAALDRLRTTGAAVGWSDVLNRAGWLCTAWLELAERRQGGAL